MGMLLYRHYLESLKAGEPPLPVTEKVPEVECKEIPVEEESAKRRGRPKKTN